MDRAKVSNSAITWKIEMPNAALEVLLVEDDPWIALTTEDMLLDLSRLKVTVASNLYDALRLEQDQRFDFAVLDFELGNCTNSLPLAAQLALHGVPFVFVTGSVSEVREQLPEARILHKPVAPEGLAAELQFARQAA